MSLENAPELYSQQWTRLVEGDSKGQPWGLPVPTRAEMNGKTAEDLRRWAANCKAKVAFFLGRIPDDPTENDGFWECRVHWMAQRADHLLMAAYAVETGGPPPPQRTPAIHPMPRERLPFNARPAFNTKREREESENGSGYLQKQSETVEEPSPSVTIHLAPALLKPFQVPRKRLKVSTESAGALACDEKLSPPSSPSDASFSINEEDDEDPVILL